MADGTRLLRWCAAAGIVLALQAGGRGEARHPATAGGPPVPRESRGAPPATAPAVAWEPNAGQAPPGVLAVGRGGGVTVLVEADGARLLVPGGAVRAAIRGAGGGPARFDRRLPGRSHYFVGADPSRWRRGIPHHGSVTVGGAAGSVTWTSRRGRPAFDLALPAGTDAAALELRFEGAGTPRLAAGGSLEVPAGDGVLVHSPPVAWQEAEGARVPVPARWVLRGPGRAGFEVASRDPRLPLVIDPEIRFVRLLGGSGPEQALQLAPGPDGSLLLSGATASLDFPVEAPLQGSAAGGGDAFVARVDPGTGTLAWATYLGGARKDAATGIAADGAGIVVVGTTSSSDFPTVAALDDSLEASDATGVGAGIWDDGFVTRLSASGDAIAWSTYLGGDREREFLTGVALAPDGSVRLCGGTSDFHEVIDAPLVVNATTTLGAPKWQAFWVASLPADGSSLAWLVAIGYTPSYSLSGIAVAPDGDAFVVGSAWGNTFVENARQPVAGSPANYDGWVARVKADGSGVDWATFLGGGGAELGLLVATDAEGACYVAGRTDSTDFPVTAGAIQPTRAAQTDAFVAKISPDGQDLVYSTYHGGAAADTPTALAVGPGGEAVIVGVTGSADLPGAAAPAGVAGTVPDAFVARISPDGGRLLHGFRWGGDGSDSATGLALQGTDILLGAWSASPAIPGTTAAPTAGGDLVLLRFDPRPSPVIQLDARMSGPATARLTWNAAGVDADAFRVERRVEDGEWAVLATVPAPAVLHDDGTVATHTRYVYRVFSERGPDASVASNEAILDTTPRVPEGLVATVVHSRQVDLSWTNMSEGETGHELQRAGDDGVFATVAIKGQDVVFHPDTTVLPDRTYAWRVRTFNGGAVSPWSNEAVATTPASLGFRVRRGTIVLSPRPGRDAARILGDFEPLPSGDGGFDPRESGLLLVAGGWTGTVVAEVPALDDAWRVRGSRYAWRSARGVAPGVRVRVDTEAGTLSVRVRRAAFTPEPGTPLRLGLASGPFQGSSDDTWVRKGRRLRYRAAD